MSLPVAKEKDTSKKENKKPAKKSEDSHPWENPISGNAKDKRKKKTASKPSSKWDQYPGDDED